MGIDDRDYMRERYRERQGKATGSTFWNDRKSRVEQPHDRNGKSVPLGSASWIGGNGGGGGGWFDAASRRFQHRHDRHRPKRLVRVHPAQKWIMLLWAVPILFPAYREAKRSGWFPDRAAEIRFRRPARLRSTTTSIPKPQHPSFISRPTTPMPSCNSTSGKPTSTSYRSTSGGMTMLQRPYHRGSIACRSSRATSGTA